jgi:hypothetical protein
VLEAFHWPRHNVAPADDFRSVERNELNLASGNVVLDECASRLDGRGVEQREVATLPGDGIKASMVAVDMLLSYRHNANRHATSLEIYDLVEINTSVSGWCVRVIRRPGPWR